jgi:MoxR-like ATPase
MLRGSGHVVPDDIRAIAPDVLRHRIGLTFEAEAQGISSDKLIEHLLARVPLP